MKTVGERIAAVRGGMPTAEFAKRCGVGKATLLSYEKNETEPKVSFLQVLINDFGVDPQWLLLGDGEPPEKDRRESILLDHFRHCDEQGKDAMLTAGAAMAQPREDRRKKKAG